MQLSSTHHALRALAMTSLDSGRDIGRQLEENADNYPVTHHYALAPQLNRLGLSEAWNPTPFTLADNHQLYQLTVSQRCYLYEALGYIDANLIFACPGPGMCGFVIEAIGSESQKAHFFSLFKNSFSRSCFAMSELARGSDASAIRTSASKVAGGWLISGEKYFIGNGAIADIGIVFARTAEGPLGLNMFLFEPAKVTGFSAVRLPVFGVPGSNIAHLRFDEMFLDDNALVGAHLNPAQRFSAAALSTFDNLRPCVGALALGVIRALLDHLAELGRFASSADACWLRHRRRTLSAALNRLLTIADRMDNHQIMSRQIGLAKSETVALAEKILHELLHRCDAGLASDLFYCKSWRDIKSFEYTEGTRNIHLLNGSMLFRSEAEHV